MTALPSVSIIVPCRNEERYIRGFLDSVLASTYPADQMELLIVDGISEDGTRENVLEYAKRNPLIRLLDNPKKSTPAALNVAVTNATGDIIIRMDVHSFYPPDYVEKCVRYLEQYSADNVGGIRRSAALDDGFLGSAIACSVSHPFTAGNALYRTGVSSPRWVDTVFGGCYRKDVFQRIGLFNEKLTRSQDREFNYRLLKAGGRILLVPDVHCTYYVRSNLREFWNWAIECGKWPFYGSRLSGQRFYSWRNFVPLVFILSLLVSLAGSMMTPWGWWLFGGISIAYMLASLFFAFWEAWKTKNPRYLIVLPFVFFLTHVLYGIGTILGILTPIDKKNS